MNRRPRPGGGLGSPPDLRVGFAAYSLFGGEYQDSVGQTTPLSRGALGAAWSRGRWSLSAEGGINAGELNAAAAVDFRAARWLGLSAAGRQPVRGAAGRHRRQRRSS
jgi:hypothetical protein